MARNKLDPFNYILNSQKRDENPLFETPKYSTPASKGINQFNRPGSPNLLGGQQGGPIAPGGANPMAPAYGGSTPPTAQPATGCVDATGSPVGCDSIYCVAGPCHQTEMGGGTGQFYTGGDQPGDPDLTGEGGQEEEAGCDCSCYAAGQFSSFGGNSCMNWLGQSQPCC